MFRSFKKFGMILLSFSMLLTSIPSVNYAENTPNIDNAVVMYIGSSKGLVNGKELPVDAPIIENNRTLVPVRFIAEKLGAKVTWDESTKAVTIKGSGKTIKFFVGRKTLLVNGKHLAFPVPPKVISGKTFVPVRAIAEALGKQVFFDRNLVIVGDTANSFTSSMVDNLISRVNGLPTITSLEMLKTMLTSKDTQNYRLYAMDSIAEEAAPAEPASTAGGAEKSADYSATNVQVQGVDEADIVKTDGQYIYQINNSRVVVAEAYPAENMKVLSTLTFEDKDFSPTEMYVDSKYLTVIGSYYTSYSGGGDISPMEKMSIMPIRYPYYSSGKVRTIVYDIKDKANITKLREVDVDGSYVSSRKVGSSVYVISNKNVYVYGGDDFKAESLLPNYRDTAIKEGEQTVELTSICYFPDTKQTNYMMIAAIDLDKQEEAASISTFIGSGSTTYATQNSLYVADNRYEDGGNVTRTYKFTLSSNQIAYVAKGDVPGTLLNQFSLDENNGYLRVATTVQGTWSEAGQTTSKNNVYVLDSMMNIVGRLEDIAPGEKIYSVRYMGDRGYMVTFRQVDPLFTIDLKDPTNPKILGALKIPGYSDYLHPYDENHIIGIGKDTVAMGESAYYLGMKMAIFDVTDVGNPVQMFTENIGDRGTDSEALRNHKAFLFSKEKNLLALPITLMEVKNPVIQTDQNYNYPQYGEFSFQGAYVYNIDLVNGFKLKGKITHMTDEEIKKAGSYWYDPQSSVDRILYIDNVLYTLSQKMIKANNLGDLAEKNTLSIPQEITPAPISEQLKPK